MGSVRFYFAWFIAKISGWILRMLRYSATSLPGFLALRISPDFICYMEKYCKGSIVTVTGTNGKTTTSGILAHILKTTRSRVLHNFQGANMIAGIATTLAMELCPCSKKDYYILETDEAYLKKLYDQIDANYLIVTNLFEDQLDRYGDIRKIAGMIENAISKNPDLTLLLNADNPLVSMMADSNKRIYYGIKKVDYFDGTENIAEVSKQEILKCACGKNFVYDKFFYGNLGHCSCDCGYERKPADYDASVKVFKDYSEIKILKDGTEYSFKIPMAGLYNVYNALAAISLSLELGVDVEIIQKALNTYDTAFGRGQQLMVNGKKVFVQLIKNTTGANESLKLLNSKRNARLLVLLNDDFADGRDISWINDAHFEYLKDFNKKIIVGGTRAQDMVDRLNRVFGNKNEIEIVQDERKATLKAIDETLEDESLVILSTYTALMKIKNILI